MIWGFMKTIIRVSDVRLLILMESVYEILFYHSFRLKHNGKYGICKISYTVCTDYHKVNSVKKLHTTDYCIKILG